ncbi:MAG: DeoR/GlpR family DNA-binding transcription regulator [Tissierellia bacterium]|nr:DeoR/GlpR family DNA-binding transcription regulator [Tissierellia bacterium]
MNKKTERRKEIIKVLQLRNGVTIKELSGLFNVSEMTIRRDLQTLESENIIQLVHGAAIYNPKNDTDKIITDYNLVTEKNRHNEAKNRIGKYAASLIDSKDFIIIDTGSTTERILPSVGIDKNFTLLCYCSNIMIPAITKPNIKLIMGGGEYKHDTMMFASTNTVDYIKRIRATKVFVSAAGVDDKFGVTCTQEYEIDVKKAAMSSSIEKILLVDSSKFGKVTSAYFAEIEDFDMIITDRELASDWEEKILEKKIELVKV